MKTCHYCGPTDRELRPYGPEGSDICFPCMKADPEREEAAGRALGALLDSTLAVAGHAAIGTAKGPTTLRDALSPIHADGSHADG